MTSTRPGLAREAANNFRVGVLTGAIGGVLLGFFFATATLALNPDLLDSLSDVLVLLLGLQAVYAVFCLALGLLGAVGKTLIYARTGQSLSDTKTAAFITGAVFFLVTATYGYLWCRWHRIGGLSPDRMPDWSDVPILLAIGGAALLLARLMTYAFYLLIVHFKKPERRQPGDLRKAFFVLVYMTGAFAFFVVALHLTRPSPLPFGGLTRDQVVPVDERVLLLGVDGMDRTDVERMRELGLLAWAEPIVSGVHRPLRVLGPRIPPSTWTLVATGQNLEAHGIVDYQTQIVRGLSRPFTITPNQVGLFQLFQDVLPFFNLTRPVPMRSYMRGAKGLWNIATDANVETAVVNWWVSWPAERILGKVVTNQAHLRLALPRDSGTPLRPQGETYPGSLLLELAPLADGTQASAADPEIQRSFAVFAELGLPAEILESDLFYARAATHLWRTDAPKLWMLYLPGPDILRRLLGRDIVDPDARARAFARGLEAYWRALGPALEETFSGTSGVRRLCLFVPGWTWTHQPPADGVFALSGPGTTSIPSSGSSEEDRAPVTLADVTPTVLWMLGLPHSEEMEGTVRANLLDASAQEELHAPRSIASYGPLPAGNESAVAGELDDQMLQLLRSLGYIDG